MGSGFIAGQLQQICGKIALETSGAFRLWRVSTRGNWVEKLVFCAVLIYLFICLFIYYLFICLFTFSFIYLFVYLFIYLFINFLLFSLREVFIRSCINSVIERRRGELFL